MRKKQLTAILVMLRSCLAMHGQAGTFAIFSPFWAERSPGVSSLLSKKKYLMIHRSSGVALKSRSTERLVELTNLAVLIGSSFTAGKVSLPEPVLTIRLHLLSETARMLEGSSRNLGAFDS